MRKVDLFWKTNKQWWEYRNGEPVLKENAPPEVKESYKRYLEQMRRGCKGRIGMDGQYIADDRRATPEYFEMLKNMTVEEFKEHIEKLTREEATECPKA